MTGRVRTNNNNALDPRTMPPGGATSGSAGRRSVQHGASVPVLLGQRAVGAARTTALDKKFAAVGYDPVAMQGFVTNFDTNRLIPRYKAIIDDLLETFDKEFSDICNMRDLFYKNSAGMTYYFIPLSKHTSTLGNFIRQFTPIWRANYFEKAMLLRMTIPMLEGILDEWRKDRPSELDLRKMADAATRIAADGLGVAAVTALKAELVECDCETADHDAVRKSNRAEQNGFLFTSDRKCARALDAFKRSAIPAFIALIEDSDPAGARKIFSERLQVYSKDMEMEPEYESDYDSDFEIDDGFDDGIAEDPHETYAKKGARKLSKLMTEHDDNSKRDDYIGFMKDVLYLYSKVTGGGLREQYVIVTSLHGLFERTKWNRD